mgnify:FL=1
MVDAHPAGGIMVSIHALREEGDQRAARGIQPCKRFLSTPSARRATRTLTRPEAPEPVSIHALREEGDATPSKNTSQEGCFYPRPPRGGRQKPGKARPRLASFYPRPPRGGRLRVDFLTFYPLKGFYPRPPRGGRPSGIRICHEATVFLSTPSARRATHRLERLKSGLTYFYPRPPRGGRRVCVA